MPRLLKEYFLLLDSIIGVVISYPAFITFFIFKNYHATIWSIITASSASMSFHINCLNFRNVLNQWYSLNGLKAFHPFGVVTATISFAAFIWYLFGFFYYAIPLIPVSDSYIIAAIWAFISAHQALSLICSSKHFSQNYDSLNNTLTNEEEE